jgi:hypothetical protein
VLYIFKIVTILTFLKMVLLIVPIIYMYIYICCIKNVMGWIDLGVTSVNHRTRGMYKGVVIKVKVYVSIP